MGRPIYVLENLVDSDTLCCSSSEDASGWYNDDNVYNVRPSYPWRATGKGAAGSPEWLCVECLPQTGTIPITFVGLYNHNFDVAFNYGGGDRLTLKACVGGCQLPGVTCNWNAPDAQYQLHSRRVADHENIYGMINLDYFAYRLDIINQNQTYNLEIGDFVLGVWDEFTANKCRVVPGRDDGPIFSVFQQTTQHGQPYDYYAGFAEKIYLSFRNINTAAQVDELQVFLKAVMASGNRFIIVPDRDLPFSYMVRIPKVRDFAKRIMYGSGIETRDWDIPLETMPVGRRLQ